MEISQRSVGSITYLQFTGAREEFAILVETAGHNAISGVKRFFHTVTVMDVNVNVKDSWVVAKKFQDA